MREDENRLHLFVFLMTGPKSPWDEPFLFFAEIHCGNNTLFHGRQTVSWSKQRACKNMHEIKWFRCYGHCNEGCSWIFMQSSCWEDEIELINWGGC